MSISPSDRLSSIPEESFSLHRTARLTAPKLPYRKIKDRVLGPDFCLNLIFIGEQKARQLNRQYRRRDYPANVLTFPLSDTEGEIFINLFRARRQAKRFDQTYRQFVALLFIHGLLHLKGMQHGGTMEKQEKELLRRFGL